MSVIQINRTFLRNGIRHKCLISGETVTYEQRKKELRGVTVICLAIINLQDQHVLKMEYITILVIHLEMVHSKLFAKKTVL